jgi:hypothetical protein
MRAFTRADFATRGRSRTRSRSTLDVNPKSLLSAIV